MTALRKEHAPYGAPEVPSTGHSATLPSLGVCEDSPGVHHSRASGAFSGIDGTWIEHEQPLRISRPARAQWRMEVRATQEVAALSGVELSPVDAIWAMREQHQDELAACLAGQC
jgi:hypothetical protein